MDCDEANELLNINLSAEGAGDLWDKESDSDQEEPQDAFCALAHTSQNLLSCSQLVQMVNKLTPMLFVPAGPSHHLVRDRPILIRVSWAKQVDQEFRSDVEENTPDIL